jgi:predicted DNA-binding protein
VAKPNKKSGKKAYTLRIPVDIIARVERVSLDTERPVSYVLLRIIKDHFATQDSNGQGTEAQQ